MSEIENDQEKAEPIDCTVSVEESGPWKKKVSVQIPRQQIDKELNSQYGELLKTAEVPGFRKGHAPKQLVEKRFGEDVTNQTKLRLLAQAFEKIDEEQDFEVLGEPDFDPEKIELPETGDMDFDYEIEVKPEFEIPQLEGIKIEKHIVEITDERVSDAMDELRSRRGHMEEVEVAEENDLVWADVVMKVEGVQQSEKAENTMIRCDSTALMGVLVDDMAKVLGGVKIGDSRTCSAEVADTHEKEDYRGKKADFTIEVKIIRRLIPAELNEEFLATFGVQSEDDLKRSIQENLEDRLDQEIRRDMSGQVYEYLEKNVEFELPTGVAARHADKVLARQYYNLLQQGIPDDQIRENMEKLRASSGEQAARELKMIFIMECVAEKLDVQVNDMELNGRIAQIAATRKMRPDRLREDMTKEGQLDSLKTEMREAKAIERLLEMADVVDAPAEKPVKPVKKVKKAKKKAESKTSDKDDDKNGK